MKHAQRITLTLIVAALVAFVLWYSSCRTATRAASAGVAAVVASPAGPGASGLAAMAGDAFGDRLADMLGAEKEFTAAEYRKILEDAGKELERAHKTIAELQAREPIRVPIEVPVDRPFIPSWVWWSVAGFFAFRFRHGLAALFASLTTGGVKAALLTLAGIVWGGPVADKAKEAVSAHEQSTPRALALRRLRRVPPPPATSPTSQNAKETLPHDA